MHSVGFSICNFFYIYSFAKSVTATSKGPKKGIEKVSEKKKVHRTIDMKKVCERYHGGVPV